MSDVSRTPAPELDWTKFSPVAMWRDWVLKSEAQWSESLSQLFKDPKSGKPMARQADEFRMLHRMYNEMAQASLAAMNLPSRSDFEALDERMGRVEDGLAQVSGELTRLREALVGHDLTRIESRPTRDRKPPRSATASARKSR